MSSATAAVLYTEYNVLCWKNTTHSKAFYTFVQDTVLDKTFSTCVPEHVNGQGFGNARQASEHEADLVPF